MVGRPVLAGYAYADPAGTGKTAVLPLASGLRYFLEVPLVKTTDASRVIIRTIAIIPAIIVFVKKLKQNQISGRTLARIFALLFFMEVCGQLVYLTTHHVFTPDFSDCPPSEPNPAAFRSVSGATAAGACSLDSFQRVPLAFGVDTLAVCTVALSAAQVCVFALGCTRIAVPKISVAEYVESIIYHFPSESERQNILRRL